VFHRQLNKRCTLCLSIYCPSFRTFCGIESEQGARLLYRRGLDEDVYTYNMKSKALAKRPSDALFDLPCACQNLRRLTRVITRIYDQELRKAGLEITQFGLLTALAATGEANQKRLSAGFVMDSTTLTRTLGLLRKQGWVQVERGKDRRERRFRLTRAGKRQLAAAQPYWQLAEGRLQQELGDEGWKRMKETVARITRAGMAA
jgi:DNA-binding MarR family transcriptional regulator